jgi:2'-5' RNA ligase
MRTFVGLDIDDAIRRRIEQFMDGVREFVPEVRWVKPESLHVTLKFIGEQPAENVERIKAGLAAIRGNSFSIGFRGHGFFPTAKAARVFWLGIEAAPELANLACAIDSACVPLGIAKEDREFSPHLTLARSGSGAPVRRGEDKANRRFARLQEKLAAFGPLEFGTMTAREFFLYESKTARDGAKYTKIARFDLASSSLQDY